MSRKSTLRTGCSNAEEELLNCADQMLILRTYYLKNKLPQNIEAWNEEEIKTSSKTASKATFIRTRRSQSVVGRDYSSISTAQFAEKATKQELKFKLKHYENQMLQPLFNIHVHENLTSVNLKSGGQKQDFVAGTRIKGFERVKRIRNFSISFRKHSQKSQKVQQGQAIKKVSPESERKFKEVVPLKTTFYPLCAQFETFEQEEKLAQRLRQIFKKRSYGLTL